MVDSKGRAKTGRAASKPTAPERAAAPRLVRKRDGRLVAFDRDKIELAVIQALRAAGEEDESFARDVARVVDLALAREVELATRSRDAARRGRAGDSAVTLSVPDIESIQDKVEQALIGMGRAGVAKAYILYRDKRARVRRTLERGGEPLAGRATVRTPEMARDAAGESEPSAADGEGPALAGPRVREAERTGAWSRARIAAALVTEADLPREVAEKVAGQVEQRVLESGLDQISTGLIRAMVDGELVQLGLTSALARTEPVAIPRHDLKRVIGGEGAAAFEPWLRPGEMRTPKDSSEADFDAIDEPRAPERERLDPAGLERVLSGEVLRRLALTEALDAISAELHLSGELHVEDLHHPHQVLTLSLPSELLLCSPGAGEAGAGDAAFALLEALPTYLARTSRGVCLDDLGGLLSELVRSTRSGSALGLAAWLRSMNALAAASGKRIDLISPGSRYASARARLIEGLARAGDLPGLPRLFLDEAEVPELLAEGAADRRWVETAIERGRFVTSWSSEDQRFAGPGLRRRSRERGLVACGGAVALNLPRLARAAAGRAPRDSREDLFLSDLYALAGQAVRAAGSFATFQAASQRSGQQSPLNSRVTFAITPVGLAQALELLGDGEVDPEQGARVQGVLHEACARLADPAGPSLCVSSFFGDRARLRLAWLDADRRGRVGVRQPMLFGGLLLADDELAVRAFDEGLGGLRAPRWRRGEVEAEVSRTLSSGALWPPLSSGHHGSRRFVSARARRGPVSEDLLLPLESPDGLAPDSIEEPARLRLVRDGETL